MAVVPMLCGSSFKNKGVQTLLDYVCAFLPSPLDTENVIGTNPNTGAEEDRKPSDDEKTSALAFKIATDPYVGRLDVYKRQVVNNYNMGFITNNERYNQVIDIWTHVNSELSNILMKTISSDDQGFNSVYTVSYTQLDVYKRQN